MHKNGNVRRACNGRQGGAISESSRHDYDINRTSDRRFMTDRNYRILIDRDAKRSRDRRWARGSFASESFASALSGKISVPPPRSLTFSFFFSFSPSHLAPSSIYNLPKGPLLSDYRRRAISWLSSVAGNDYGATLRKAKKKWHRDDPLSPTSTDKSLRVALHFTVNIPLIYHKSQSLDLCIWSERRGILNNSE